MRSSRLLLWWLLLKSAVEFEISFRFDLIRFDSNIIQVCIGHFPSMHILYWLYWLLAFGISQDYENIKLLFFWTLVTCCATERKSKLNTSYRHDHKQNIINVRVELCSNEAHVHRCSIFSLYIYYIYCLCCACCMVCGKRWSYRIPSMLWLPFLK